MAEIVSRAVSWRYYISIDGITAGEFTECSGLIVERNNAVINEGGRNDYQVKLPGGISRSNITLKRGLVDLELLDWLLKNSDQNTVKPERKNVTIFLANESGETAFTWELLKAYPVKWTGPQLSAESNGFSMEELELVPMEAGASNGSSGGGGGASSSVEDEEDEEEDPTQLDDMELRILAEKVLGMLQRETSFERERTGLKDQWGGWRQS